MALKLMPLFRFYAKEKRFEKELSERRAEILVISSTQDNCSELKHLLGQSDRSRISFFTFEDVKNLDESIAGKIESADVIVVYSKNPLAELPEVAFSLQAIRCLNFRYFCVLYGKDSHIAVEILRECSVANPCKIRKSLTKEALIGEMRNYLLKVAPLESVATILELEIFDGYRERETVRLLLKVAFRFWALYSLSPIIALYYLHEISAVAYLLSRNLTGSSRALKNSVRGLALLAPLFFRKRSRFKIPAIVPLVFLLVFLLLDLQNPAADHE